MSDNKGYFKLFAVTFLQSRQAAECFIYCHAKCNNFIQSFTMLSDAQLIVIIPNVMAPKNSALIKEKKGQHLLMSH